MTDLLTQAGYWLAAMLVASLPAALLYWLLIHPLARYWRRLGPLPTYFIVGAICLGVIAWILQFRHELLAVRYPFQWTLAGPGLVLYALSIYIEIECRRHLKFRILAGAPELGSGDSRLLTAGIYDRVRNPRYLDVLLGMTGIAMILNYPALYWTIALCVPVGWLLIVLEERELEERFGQEYLDYKRRVPRIIPRLG